MYVFITDETHELIRQASWTGVLTSTSKKVSGGVMIELAEDTIERLHEKQLANESLGDTINRIMLTWKTGGVN